MLGLERIDPHRLWPRTAHAYPYANARASRRAYAGRAFWHYLRQPLGTSYAAPRNDLERQIAAIWSDLLGIDEIGIDDNFFDLGGNSLVSINMVTRMKKSLGIEKIAARVVYEAPTIGAWR